ncbi:hypothetical protein [Pseudarthrobacter sp. DSP2-3-2b1]|uniref:hypothetical protein n=1 Tax=Pseudarthrobacter sp. DSP2-3-2b1 TaxID=2804661 RepID=UPI003CF2DEDF
MNLGNIIRNAMGRTTSGTKAGGAVRRTGGMNSAGRANTAGRAGGTLANRIRGMLKRR